MISFDRPDQSGLHKVVVQLGDGQSAQNETFYVTSDGREIIRGELQELSSDPWRSIREKLGPFLASAPSLGPESAPVTVAEFSDLECPYCKQLSAELDELVEALPGKVRVVFKPFPLEDIHPWAMQAAVAAECISQQDLSKFWVFQRLVFGHQQEISAQNAKDRLAELSIRSGADGRRYDGCVRSPQSKAEVDASILQGRDLGISGTPTLFINGMPISGAVSLETLRMIVKNEVEFATGPR